MIYVFIMDELFAISLRISYEHLFLFSLCLCFLWMQFLRRLDTSVSQKSRLSSLISPVKYFFHTIAKEKSLSR